MTQIISCTKCAQKLRIPASASHLEVTCPKCRNSWEWVKESSYFGGDQRDEKIFDEAFGKKSPDFNATLNIAVVGKVSTGKSSLINALLGCGRGDPTAPVGATSGVTTKVTSYQLDKNVRIVDCPGLDDVKAENSEETRNFLSSIDVGIFVVTGSADATQKSNFESLKAHLQKGKIFVVLNKIDEWDDHKDEAYQAVVSQWRNILGASKIYGVCTKGYDPEMRQGSIMTLRGVDELRKDIFSFLETKGKDILLAKNLKDKNAFADKIVYSSLAAVAVEAFVPGSAIYITATQTAAIVSLNFLYTGNAISRQSALSLIPQFAGRALGTSAFLWLKSVLPPTGVVDIAASFVAVSITYAMLAAVKKVLSSGSSLDDIDHLMAVFQSFKESKIDPNELIEKANLAAIKK